MGLGGRWRHAEEVRGSIAGRPSMRHEPVERAPKLRSSCCNAGVACAARTDFPCVRLFPFDAGVLLPSRWRWSSRSSGSRTMRRRGAAGMCSRFSTRCRSHIPTWRVSSPTATAWGNRSTSRADMAADKAKGAPKPTSRTGRALLLRAGRRETLRRGRCPVPLAGGARRAHGGGVGRLVVGVGRPAERAE